MGKINQVKEVQVHSESKRRVQHNQPIKRHPRIQLLMVVRFLFNAQAREIVNESTLLQTMAAKQWLIKTWWRDNRGVRLTDDPKDLKQDVRQGFKLDVEDEVYRRFLKKMGISLPQSLQELE